MLRKLSASYIRVLCHTYNSTAIWVHLFNHKDMRDYLERNLIYVCMNSGVLGVGSIKYVYLICELLTKQQINASWTSSPCQFRVLRCSNEEHDWYIIPYRSVGDLLASWLVSCTLGWVAQLVYRPGSLHCDIWQNLIPGK